MKRMVTHLLSLHCHFEPKGRACTPKCSTLSGSSARRVTARRRGNPTESRCEGAARGNLKSSLAFLGTRLRRSAPRNDHLLGAFLLIAFIIINLSAFFAFTSIAQAVSPEVIQSLTAKLESWNVEDIWPEVKEALEKEPRDLAAS